MKRGNGLNLEYFRALLEEQHVKLLKNPENIKNKTKLLDASVEDTEDMKTQNKINQFQIQQIRKELKEMKYALDKIWEKDYGICKEMKRFIPTERLEVYSAVRTIIRG